MALELQTVCMEISNKTLVTVHNINR